VTKCIRGCGEDAVALVAAPQTGAGQVVFFAIIRPLNSATKAGAPHCVDCTHVEVDLMLMRARDHERQP